MNQKMVILIGWLIVLVWVLILLVQLLGSKRSRKKRIHRLIELILILGLPFLWFFQQLPKQPNIPFEVNQIPPYTNQPYVIINANRPYFQQEDYERQPFEQYGELDVYGRCTQAFARIDVAMMPLEPRGSIGMIKPSGWHTVRYDFIDGKYLYNRCHLIAYALTGENDNEKNLITGTRYFNVEAMKPWEMKVVEYIATSGQDVLYRVTPIFQDDELVARGVLIEASSVADHGASLSFCVYCYNVQPQIEIDYRTGNSRQIQ